MDETIRISNSSRTLMPLKNISSTFFDPGSFGGTKLSRMFPCIDILQYNFAVIVG